jgi:hypothetical protein
MLLARIEMLIGGRDFLASVDNQARRRAPRKPSKTADRHFGAALFLEFTNSALEGVKNFGARKYRQKPIATKQLAALGRLDPTIGAGDQRSSSDHGVQQFAIAIVGVRCHDLGVCHM